MPDAMDMLAAQQRRLKGIHQRREMFRAKSEDIFLQALRKLEDESVFRVASIGIERLDARTWLEKDTSEKDTSRELHRVVVEIEPLV